MSVNNAIKNHYITFFAILAVFSIVAAMYFAMLAFQPLPVEGNQQLELTNSYREKLYESVDCLNNIESNLGKVTTSHDRQMQSQLLAKVAVESGNLSVNISTLPVESSENVNSIEKYCNQLQQYCISLIRRLSTDKLDSKDIETIGKVQQTSGNIKKFFKDAIDGDSKALQDGTDDVSTLLDDSFANMEEVFTYEKLIYDGPFSDSINEDVAKVAIDPDSASDIAKRVFGEAAFIGKTGDGQYLIFSVRNGMGRVLIATDGKVAEAEMQIDQQGKAKFDTKHCINQAEKKMAELGMDVKAIWVSREQDNIVYVNLAPVQNDVIIYPDIVKVAVSNVSGEVVGIEARSYVANHKERNVMLAEMPESFKNGYNVKSVRKALVQKGEKEILCYQLECDNNGQYFVYLDKKGHEVEIFKVVKGTEGYTVM